jgi:hypothetical protein
MKKNKVGENQFIDQKNEKVFTVDQISLKVTHVSESPMELMP